MSDKIVVAVALSAAALLLLTVGLLNHQHRALLSAKQDAERAEVQLRGQIAELEESRKQVQANADTLLAQNDALREAVAKARAAAPGAQIVSTEVLKTGPVAVNQVPPPEPTTAPAGSSGGGPPPLPPCPSNHYGPGAEPGAWVCLSEPVLKLPISESKQEVVAAPACALSPGDSVSFAVSEIYLRAREGTKLVTGTAELWREAPPPRAKLATGTFQSTASDASEVTPPAEPRWGAELDGYCARGGCGLGGSVLFPPVAFWGLRLEPRLGAQTGVDWAATAGLGLRF